MWTLEASRNNNCMRFVIKHVAAVATNFCAFVAFGGAIMRDESAGGRFFAQSFSLSLSLCSVLSLSLSLSSFDRSLLCVCFVLLLSRND